MVTDLGIIECIGDGWERYRVHMGIATGGYLLYMVMSLAGSFIPILNFFFAFFVAPALAGGVYLFFLNVALGRNPRIDDLFEGFRRYGALMGLFWLSMLVVFVGILPSAIVWIVLAAVQSQHAFAIGLGLMVANVLLLIWFLVRYALIYFILMDDRQVGLFDALRRSAMLTQGNVENLFLLGIVSSVICVAAAICLVIPLIFAIPAMQTAFAVAYLKLKQYQAAPSLVPESPGLSSPPIAG